MSLGPADHDDERRNRTPCSSDSPLSMKPFAARKSASACANFRQSIACVNRCVKTSIRTSGSALVRLQIWSRKNYGRHYVWSVIALLKKITRRHGGSGETLWQQCPGMARNLLVLL